MGEVGSVDSLVVVGVDGSANSLGALHWAADEAARRRCRLRIVHVLGSQDPYRSDEADRLVDGAAAYARGRQPGIEVEGLVHRGGATAELSAESEHADLVVVGGGSHGGIAELLLGSVSGQVAAHSRCPVLVIHNGQAWAGPETAPPSVRWIVAGIDDSPESDLAAGFAFDEAAVRGAGVMAVRAWRQPFPPWRGDVRPLIVDIAELETTEHHLLSGSVAPWQAKYPHVPVRQRLIPDAPGAALVTAAREAQAVVVGSHGHGRFTGLLLNSTSQYVLMHAACPVYVVHGAGSGAAP